MFNWLQNKLEEQEKEYKRQEEQKRLETLRQEVRCCISLMETGRTLGECEAYLEGKGYSEKDAIYISGLAFTNFAIGLHDIHGNSVANWNLNMINYDRVKKVLGSEDKYNLFCKYMNMIK